MYLPAEGEQHLVPLNGAGGGFQFARVPTRRGEGDNRRWDGWVASLTQRTWVWEVVKDREAWHAAVHEVANSRTRLNNTATTCYCFQDAELRGPILLFTVALLVLSKKFSRRWYINLRASISKSRRKWGSHIPRNTGRSISLQKSRLFLCICYIKNVWGQPFPRFLASGTDFMEDNFSMDQGGWGGMVWGWFKLITFIVHFISNLMLPLM